MSSDKSIARSAGIIGFATLVSRILGFARDIIFAAFFGTGLYAQAFVVAFRIPNILRDLIGEGAANAAVVPVLVEELAKKGEKRFWELANILLNVTLLVLSALTITGFILAKPLVIVIAFGFLEDPTKLDVTVALTRALFPYLILIGLAAYGMGVLNSVKHFTAPAFGMSMLNVSLITCMLLWRGDVKGLVVGVLFGGLLQVLIQIPALLRRGLVLDQRKFLDPEVKKIGRLLVPRVFGGGIYQINIIISTMLASLGGIVGAGAIAALHFSSRIWQFPLAVFAFALAQAALPTLSGHMAKGDMENFKKSLNFLLRSVSFILLPASAGLIALSVPITRTLFQRGAFGAYSTMITSSALFFYAWGLLSYGCIKILVNGYYSMQDTKTPVKVAAFSLVLNIVLSLLLMFPLKIGGIALANSISGIFNCTVLFLILRKKIGGIGEKNIMGSFARILTASVLMGIFASRFYIYLGNVFAQGVLFASIFRLGLTIITSAILYLLLCQLLRVEEARELRTWILKRR